MTSNWPALVSVHFGKDVNLTSFSFISFQKRRWTDKDGHTLTKGDWSNFTGKFISSIFKIYDISDEELFWRFLYINRRVYSRLYLFRFNIDGGTVVCHSPVVQVICRTGLCFWCFVCVAAVMWLTICSRLCHMRWTGRGSRMHWDMHPFIGTLALLVTRGRGCLKLLFVRSWLPTVFPQWICWSLLLLASCCCSSVHACPRIADNGVMGIHRDASVHSFAWAP